MLDLRLLSAGEERVFDGTGVPSGRLCGDDIERAFLTGAGHKLSPSAVAVFSD